MKKSIHLLGEDNQHVRYIDAKERLSLLASEQVEKVCRDDGTTDGTVRLVRYAPEECRGFARGVDSPTSLTFSDMVRNAAGAIDTRKLHLIRKLRDEGQLIPASIRRFGLDRHKKPAHDLVGNAVDRSMSRVENWPVASDNNKAVTVVPGRIIGLTEA